MRVTLTVVDAAGQNLAQSSADHETFLVYRQPYRDGDRLLVDVSEPGHVRLALDAAIAPAILYLPQGRFSFSIPFGARKIAYQPHAFCGDLHRLYAAKARSEEIVAQRNLAFNPWTTTPILKLFRMSRPMSKHAGRRPSQFAMSSMASEPIAITVSGRSPVGGSTGPAGCPDPVFRPPGHAQ